MIYKNRTSRWLSGKYLTIIPIAGILFLFIAAREKIDPILKEENFLSFENNVTIKGRVTDEKGNAISNASINIKHTSKTSRTDVAGVFELNDVPLKSIIVVSHTKFSAEEIKIAKPKPYYRIVLKRKGNQVSALAAPDNLAEKIVLFQRAGR